MRVIAGAARGVSLIAPGGADTTRPTSDRAREALFNIWQESIRGARFLDLFAGSGAVGIEALSRGALAAVFVDQDRAACEAIQANLNKARLAGEVLRLPMEAALARLTQRGGAFDLIYLDPPYHSGLGPAALAAVRAGGLLAEGGVIAYEAAKDEAFAGAGVFEARRYGAAAIHFIK